MNKKVILMMILMCSVGGFSMSRPLTDSEVITTNLTVASVTQTESLTIRVKVKGMVCSFCAQGIEKTFEKLESVLEVSVDLDTMMVSLTLVPSMSISDDAIRQVIEDAGYFVERIER